MGGKDTPPPCVPASPMQSRFTMGKSRSLSISSSSSSASSPYQQSPFRYVPPSKAHVNLHIDCPSTSESTHTDCGYSPIRAYIDCLTPQSLKCAIVGDSGVGKTSLLMSYVVDKFPQDHSPTIYDRFSTSITVNGKKIAVTMCDTAGQEDFAHLRPLCYPQVDVALICFSVIDHTSFENVRSKWIREIRRNCPGVPIVIVGTQIDRRDDPQVLKLLKSQGKKPLSKTEGNKLLHQCRATCYVECSALTQLNVKGAFDKAIAAALELSSSTKHTPQCTGSCSIL